MINSVNDESLSKHTVSFALFSWTKNCHAYPTINWSPHDLQFFILWVILGTSYNAPCRAFWLDLCQVFTGTFIFSYPFIIYIHLEVSNTLIFVAPSELYWLSRTSCVCVGWVDSMVEPEKTLLCDAVVTMLYLVIIVFIVFVLSFSCSLLCICCYDRVACIDCYVDAGVFRFFALIHTNSCIEQVGNKSTY